MWSTFSLFILVSSMIFRQLGDVSLKKTIGSLQETLSLNRVTPIYWGYGANFPKTQNVNKCIFSFI